MTPETAYKLLVRKSRERAMLHSCLELLGWDELVSMPHGGVENRGQQTSYLAGLLHSGWTDPALAELIAIAEPLSSTRPPDSSAAVNLSEWRRQQKRQSQLPRTLVEELAAVTTTAQQVWADARQNDDFQLFEPWLHRIVSLKRSESACLAKDADPYDPLLEEFEPGMTTAKIVAMFGSLVPALAELQQSLRGSRRRIRAGVLQRSYPVDRQRLLMESIAGEIGFDFSRGRLDDTTHPFFSSIGPGDCRIATRFNPNDITEGFFATVHEVGHALFEQGLNPADHGTPSGEVQSMGLHESQSRFWEQFIGHSRGFWEHFFPRVRDTFHEVLHDVRAAEFHAAVNRWQPGMNRVRADAASYDLHIALRFELEHALISGELPVSDIPAAWNSASQRLLGVTPANDAEGCLQDGHWSAGQFGYFPTYTLGNVYAGQLFEAMSREIPDVDRQLAAGQFAAICEWLASNVWRHPGRHNVSGWIAAVSGSEPTPEPLVENLRRRYEEVYRL